MKDGVHLVTTVADAIEAAKHNGWWKEVISEVDRRWMLKQANVPGRQKVEVVSTLFEFLAIPSSKVRAASEDSVFQEARSIIQKLAYGQKYPARIYELFEHRRPAALIELDEIAVQLISFSDSEAIRGRLTEVWQRRIDEVPEADRLLAALQINSWNERYIVRALCELAENDATVRHAVSPFFTDEYFPAQAGNEKIDRYELLAYQVFDPLWNLPRTHFEKEYITFPLKWSGTLSSSALDRLYEVHRREEDITGSLAGYFSEPEHLERLRLAISTCPVTDQYNAVFSEVVDSFERALYKVCSFTLLALIEGLLWAYARWWNGFSGPVFDRNITDLQYRSRDFELTTTSGRSAKADIGTLLRKTEFGNHFYFESIEYFCQELFNERNPVLHGREPLYGDKRKAATLLFVVENIERQITDTFKNAFAERMLEAIEQEERKENGRSPV